MIINKQTPDYQRIFSDVLELRFPQKKKECKDILEKDKLTELDVIQLNKIIFGPFNYDAATFNQSHRSYKKDSILKILAYQVEYELNNSQLTSQFKMSRNTITKWKKMYAEGLI